MNSNFWITNINSNQSERERIAERFAREHFRNFINYQFLDDFVIISDNPFPENYLEEILHITSG
jgi:hypothetical protein